VSRAYRVVLSSSLLVLSSASLARAEEPDAALGVFAGAATLAVGFGVGAAVVATSAEHDPTQNTAGWMTMQGGFLVAPIVAHGIVHEWGRGLWFAAVPAAAIGGSAAVFGIDSEAVRHAVLSEQRVIWGLFSAALFSGAAGVVDVAFAADRARSVSVTPVVGDGRYGLAIRGAL
jgi:hypothetical protein